MIVLFVTEQLSSKFEQFNTLEVVKRYSEYLKQLSVHHIFVTQGNLVEFHLHVQKITLDSDAAEELLEILSDLELQCDLKWRGQGLRFDIVKSVDN